MSRLRDEVTLLEPALSTDPYTEESEVDWDQEPTQHPNTPATVQPVSSDEAALTAETVVSRWRLFLYADAPLASWWQVRWDGDDYEVDGVVEIWKRHGQPFRKRCFLKLVDG